MVLVGYGMLRFGVVILGYLRSIDHRNQIITGNIFHFQIFSGMLLSLKVADFYQIL